MPQSCCGKPPPSASLKLAGFLNLQTALTILCGIALVLSWFDVHPYMPYAAVLFGSYFALGSAWESIKDRSLDVNFLMVLAAAGAVAVGHADDAAGLLFLFSLSSTLESMAMSKTRSAIEGLIRLRPDEALLTTPDGDRRVPVEALRIGDEVRVPPFEAIPADGTVLSGRSSVDESAMTGESLPVAKEAGDKLLTGTQNLDGMLVMSVASEVGNSALEKIVELVRDAQENKASGERISAWFGKRYTVFVLVAFALSLGGRLLYGQEFAPAMYTSLILLVALSPCALVISTPATTLSALAWAARNGILVRGGKYIEAIGRVNAAALDKTGTLTVGRPVLSEICVCSEAKVSVGGQGCVEEGACWHGHGDLSPEAGGLLRYAAAAEQYSSHPIAEAIVGAARSFGLDVPEAVEQQTHAGLGVSAKIDGKSVLVGQFRFFEDQGLEMPEAFRTHVAGIQKSGMTVALLSVDGQLAALGLRDAPRPEAKQFVENLRALGMQKVAMITGDTRQTADAVAAELGLDEVHAALLPAHKTEIIERMGQDGLRVAMVGDGVNDAPSLARASVGIAMGGLGSDIALNAADIVLMQDKLERIPQMIRLGRRTNAIIGANLIFAGGMIGFLTLMSVIAPAVMPSIADDLLPLAVIGHEGSTVVVILNGLRLLRGP